jgi:hypothetical protein
MRAYSMDIRERVIENLGQESMRKTAKGVSKSWGRGLRSMTRGDTLHGE